MKHPAKVPDAGKVSFNVATHLQSTRSLPVAFSAVDAFFMNKILQLSEA
jgi:hypothetical protein